jgi:hypothetical protein
MVRSGTTLSSPGTALVIVRQRNPVLQSRKMKERTGTLAVGELAPDFTLPAANQEGAFSLSHWLQRGPLILEFLRGTW